MSSRKYFAILLAAASAIAGAACHPIKDTSAAEHAVTDFHQKLDAGDFKEIYDLAHPQFKNFSAEKDFIAFLEAIHRKLGNVQSTERVSWNINSYNFKTNVAMSFKTKFAEGDGTEAFTYRMDGDKAVLLRYQIDSRALILK